MALPAPDVQDASTARHPDFGATIVQQDAPPPIYGGTLTMAGDGKTAIAADPDRDAIFLVDTATGSQRTISLAPHDRPFRIAEDGARRAHVTLRGTGEVLTVSLDSAEVLLRRPVCAEIRGIAYEALGDVLYVACEEGALVTLPAMGATPTRTLAIAAGARDVVSIRNELSGGVAVSNFRDASVLRVGADGSTWPMVAPNPGSGVALDAAWRMVLAPNDALLMVHQVATVASLLASPGGYGSQCKSGPVSAALSSPGHTDMAQLLGAVLPVDLAVSPNGHTVAIAVPGNARTGTSYLIYELGSLPASPCFSPLPPAQGEVVSVAFDAAGHPVLQSREPARLFVLDAGSHAVLSTITLSSTSREDTGHSIFHAAAGAQIACASCHPEGGDDGRVWTIFERQAKLRRTPSLRGTVAGTAPYHWEGNLPDIAALAHEVFTSRMGGAELDDGQKAALQTWLERIPAPRSTPPPDVASALRGGVLFEGAAQCSTCHSGQRFTNNLTVDVGTGGAFQVPPLVGLASRPPYLHDGCAQTLLDRFGSCGGDQHGATAHFTPEQTADLVAYLKTL